MNDISRQFYIILFFLIITTFLGFTCFVIADVNFIQYFLCCISCAFFKPLADLITGLLKDLFKEDKK